MQRVAFLSLKEAGSVSKPVDLSEYPDTLVRSRLRRLNGAMPCMALKSFCPVDESAGRSVDRSYIHVQMYNAGAMWQNLGNIKT